jgi:hypothetical protein
MKKLLLCSLLALSVGLYTSAQVNLLQNGDMEEQGAWIVSQGNLDDSIAFEFGSTENTLNGGVGGNLALKQTQWQEVATNITIYQALDLVGGEEYLWSCAMRDLSTHGECWWIKYVWIALEPIDGTDPEEEDIAFMHPWFDGKIFNFDGLFDTCTAAIAAESKDNIFIPEADGTYYVGLNVGTCILDAGDYHVLFDEVAMIDQDAVSLNSVINADKSNTLELHPNPATERIDFTYTIGNHGNVELSLINILGHEVASVTIDAKSAGTYSETFDCSELTDGLYYGILRVNNTITTKKVIIVK